MSKVFSRCRAALRPLPQRNNAPITGVRLLTRLDTSSHSGRALHRRTFTTANQEQVSRSSSTSSLPLDPSISKLSEHLNGLFQPLQFPPDLAARILTHTSHQDALNHNNARLSFIGRRVLQTYLLLFLHSAPSLLPGHDYEKLADTALNTYVLGEHVAPKWSLGTVMKWTPVHISPQVSGPTIDLSKLDSSTTRGVGLYKVQGTVVEAVMGGIFHQFGGSVAHRVFHTRLLPHILLPGRPEGLHDHFHSHALETCERMGGSNGPLLVAEGPKI